MMMMIIIIMIIGDTFYFGLRGTKMHNWGLCALYSSPDVFWTPVHIGPGAHPASYTEVTGSSPWE